MRMFWLVSALVSVVVGCAADDAAPSQDADTGGCSLTAATTSSGRTTPSGCEVLERDTSGCMVGREAAGLSGVWLAFSCRVELSATGAAVVAISDGRPDFRSNYFGASDECHETYTGAIQNPNSIVTKSYTIEFPVTANTQSRTMQMTAVVGLTINGVPIYGNFAAPGDDIFAEARTFDRCGGHPQMQGAYHNHAEPLSISYDDDHLVGVMRDGYPVYGRKDANGTYPADLDTFGGHVGTTPHSTGAVYHYHLNEQTSSSAGTVGEKQWFLTKGTFRGTPGSCTGC